MVTIRNAVRFNLFTWMSSFTQPAKSRIRQIEVRVGVLADVIPAKHDLGRSKKGLVRRHVPTLYP